MYIIKKCVKPHYLLITGQKSTEITLQANIRAAQRSTRLLGVHLLDGVRVHGGHHRALQLQRGRQLAAVHREVGAEDAELLHPSHVGGRLR